VEDLEISTALTSNIEKRPLVFCHCVITDLLSVNILSFNPNHFGPDYYCNLLVDFEMWWLLGLLFLSYCYLYRANIPTTVDAMLLSNIC